MHTSPPRELLVGATVRELLLSALTEWSVIGACWLAMAAGPRWAYPLLALLVAGRVHALASLAHDGAHLPPQLGRRGEAFLAEVLTGWPIGTTWRSLRAHHLRHHADTNLGTDPYLRPGLERAGALRHLGAWLSLFLIYPHWVLRAYVGALASLLPPLRPAYAQLLVVRRRVRLPAGTELEQAACADRPLALALTALFLATARWPELLGTYFFLPFLLTLAFNGRRFLLEHSHGPAADRSRREVLKVTRDTGDGWLERLLLAPRGLGYHRVHHLHPHVAHSALPALHAWYAAHDAAFGAPHAAPIDTAPQRATG